MYRVHVPSFEILLKFKNVSNQKEKVFFQSNIKQYLHIPGTDALAFFVRLPLGSTFSTNVLFRLSAAWITVI